MIKYLFALIIIAAPKVTIAQYIGVPDAGAVRNSVSPSTSIIKVPPLGDFKKEELSKNVGGQFYFEIKKINFNGNTLIDEKTLRNEIMPLINGPIDFNGLQILTEKISAIYTSYGWLARVVLPEQDVTNGEIYFNIIEAKFSGVRHEGVLPKFVNLERIFSMIKARQSLGGALRVNEIDRALLLADDLSGVSVAAAFMAGENEGDTFVVLRTSDEQESTAQIDLDNFGSRSIGQNRGALGFIVNSPSGVGDRLNFSKQFSSGGPYIRGNYSRPINNDGLRLGVSATYLSYSVILPEFASLQPSGASSSVAFDMDYPLTRSRLHNTNVGMLIEKKNFNNRTIQGDQSNYATQIISGTFSGYFFDDIGGRGANGYRVGFTAGELVDIRLGAQAQLPRKYEKINYGFTRQQRVNNSISFFINYIGQVSHRTLDSSERISIGGMNGVRAYPNGEGSGDSGNLLSIELRQRLNPEWAIAAFYDRGRSRRIYSPPLPYTLQGRGVWINWQNPKGLSAKFIWAMRNGVHPSPSQNGMNQDGSDESNRFWFQVSYPLSK